MSGIFTYIFDGIEGDELYHELFSIVENALYHKFGKNPDEKILKRMIEEWNSLSVSYEKIAVLYEITKMLREHNVPFYLSSVGKFRFILYLLDIIKGNPLPYHTHCSVCHKINWHDADYCCDKYNPDFEDGYDIYGKEFKIKDNYTIRTMSNSYGLISEFIKGHSFLKDKYRDKYGDTIFIRDLDIEIERVIPEEEVASDFYEKEELFSPAKIWELYHPYWSRPKQMDLFRQLPSPLTHKELLYNVGVMLNHLSDPDVFGWDQQADYLVKNFGYRITDFIIFPEDIYKYLLKHGYSNEKAEKILLKIANNNEFNFSDILTPEMTNAGDKYLLKYLKNKRKRYYDKAEILEYVLFWSRAGKPIY